MKKPRVKVGKPDALYQSIFGDVSRIVEAARQEAVRSVNAVMTAAYWLIGQYIVEYEQEGKRRADYGEEIIERLAADLSARYGRGFSIRNVWQMKACYLAWPIPQTVSAESEHSGNLQDTICRFCVDPHRFTLSASLVGLCAAAFGQEPSRPKILRNRSPARRLVGSPT